MAGSARTALTCMPPEEADLQRPRALQTFWDYWLEVQQGWARAGSPGPAPPRSLLNLARMRAFLDSLMLADVIRDDAAAAPADSDYRFRVYGTALANLLGADHTGAMLSTVPAPAGDMLAAIFAAVLEGRKPTAFRFEMPEPSYARIACGLACPMTRQGERIDEVLALILPEEFRWDPPPYL
jgi:hypothetical protein